MQEMTYDGLKTMLYSSTTNLVNATDGRTRSKLEEIADMSKNGAFSPENVELSLNKVVDNLNDALRYEFDKDNVTATAAELLALKGATLAHMKNVGDDEGYKVSYKNQFGVNEVDTSKLAYAVMNAAMELDSVSPNTAVQINRAVEEVRKLNGSPRDVYSSANKIVSYLNKAVEAEQKYVSQAEPNLWVVGDGEVDLNQMRMFSLSFSQEKAVNAFKTAEPVDANTFSTMEGVPKDNFN